MAGELGFDNGTVKSSGLESLKKALETEKHVEKDGVLTVDLSGRVETESKLEGYSSLVASVKGELEEKFGTKLNNMPSVIIEGNDDNLRLGTVACVNEVWKDKNDLIRNETLLVINPESIETDVELGGVSFEEAILAKVRHELTHAIVYKYCLERGIDIHEGDNRFFSELMSMTMENQGYEGVLDKVFEMYIFDQGVESIPEIFPEYLGDDEMYIFLPLFWNRLSAETGNRDLVLDLFKKWIGEKGNNTFLDVELEKTDEKVIEILNLAGITYKDTVNNSENDDLEIRSKQVIGHLFEVVCRMNKEMNDNGEEGLLAVSDSLRDRREPLTSEIKTFLEKNMNLQPGELDRKWNEWRESLGK
jgi:hypothetical protein